MNVLTHVKSNAPAIATPGQQMWRCPTGLSPTVERPPGCAGCSKAGVHNIAEALSVDLPFGQAGGRYGMIPEAQRPDVVNMHRLSAALWLWNYTLRGYIGDNRLDNAGGAADNATQSWPFEIISGAAGSLTVKGMNPKRLVTGASHRDPESGRIIWDQAAGIMVPCAASVEFARPSVLFGKAFPLVSSITPPASNDADGVTFTLHFGDGFNASNAKTPFDLMFPPRDGKYYCSVRFEFLSPPDSRDYQAPKETQWAPVSATFTTAEAHELLDGAGASTRVLFPAAGPGIFTASFSPPLPAAVDLAARLSTDRLGAGSYRTYLDLADLVFDSVEVSYWAEATAGDTTRVPGMGQCRFSRLDPSGSYKHAGGPQHCGAIASTGFAGGFYHDKCWLPGKCDQFSLDDESNGTVGDWSYLASLWTRADWIVIQTAAGGSGPGAFQLAHMAGPSILGFTGGPVARVPGGFFPSKVEDSSQPLGRRFVYSDGDGNAFQVLLHGGFWLQPYDFSPGPSYKPDAADRDSFRLGIIADSVDGWGSGKAAELRGFPWGYTGGTHLYDWSHGGASTIVNAPADSEAYLTAVDTTAVADPGTVARIRAIYEGV